MDGRQWGSNPQEEKYVIFEIQPCCTQGYFSDIFNSIQNILTSFYLSKYRSNHCLSSLFINKANVNRGSRNGMTCRTASLCKFIVPFFQSSSNVMPPLTTNHIASPARNEPLPNEVLTIIIVTSIQKISYYNKTIH